ncbi:MAG TPA: pyridoxal 5'-phosphate synthase lyase subunit PdxS, partial [Clostridiaceae bacterium]|nr:pyridoxal 5'-phosphate synthase lyase subunit PdxS [Clostridiaceae bacterium]
MTINKQTDRSYGDQSWIETLRGGVIMDVTTPEQAVIAEQAGAKAVMALERIPADVRLAGGVSRMSDPQMIQEIQNTVRIPVMAKCRIGHILEARILENIQVDMIDESEVLTRADERYHIDKTAFAAPFVCGARNLAEALRRISEGAAMIRTKGDAGTGNVAEAVTHMRQVNQEIAVVCNKRKDELYDLAKEMSVSYELLVSVHEQGRLPVINFAAGGVATPADAALMMHLGAEGVFVGSGIFRSGDPAKRAAAIVKAVANYDNYDMLTAVSTNLGEAMVGLNPE